ncbi:MAG TPA: hypothetical protein VF627_09720, partial [Abditibacterium sp.]
MSGKKRATHPWPGFFGAKKAIHGRGRLFRRLKKQSTRVGDKKTLQKSNPRAWEAEKSRKTVFHSRGDA